MRTGEDTIELGLYASGCCGVEVLFKKNSCFWRCPQCHALCDWEIVDPADDWTDVEGEIAA